MKGQTVDIYVYLVYSSSRILTNCVVCPEGSASKTFYALLFSTDPAKVHVISVPPSPSTARCFDLRLARWVLLLAGAAVLRLLFFLVLVLPLFLLAAASLVAAFLLLLSASLAEAAIVWRASAASSLRAYAPSLSPAAL
jgi:hypothetical protein